MHKSVHKSYVPDVYHFIIIKKKNLNLTSLNVLSIRVIYSMYACMHACKYVSRAPKNPQQMPCVFAHT